MTLIRFPQGRTKAVTLSYDDGVEADIRIMSILDKYRLKCTFNVNTGTFLKETCAERDPFRRMSVEQAKELYINSGHEVAVHTLTHPFLEQLTPVQITHEVMADRENIEKYFGNIAVGMAYPFGTYNDTVVDVLKSCGICYSRTVQCDESFALPQDWLRLKPTAHHNNPRLMELCDRFLDADFANRPARMFYLWGHSYEFERNNNWEIIEEFSKKMGGHDDIWYATNIEIYDYCEAYKQLRFNAAGDVCENLSSRDLYFQEKGKIYCVKSGEALHL